MNFGKAVRRSGPLRGWCVWVLAGMALWLTQWEAVAFSTGERVHGIDAVNVRATPGGQFMTTRRIGDQGTVLEGPVVAVLTNTVFVVNWYKVLFDTGATDKNPGWVAEIGMASIGVQPGIPGVGEPGAAGGPGVLLGSNTVTLTWGAVREATFYDLSVADTTTGGDVVSALVGIPNLGSQTGVFTNTVTYTATLPAGRGYRWTVSACNPAGCSSYTPVLFFQTPEPARLVVNPAQPPVQGAGAGTLNLGVTNAGGGTMVYSAGVTGDAPWLIVGSGIAGTNRGTIQLTLEANSGGTQRTGVVTVVAAGAEGSPVAVQVVQAGGTLGPVITNSPRGVTVVAGTTATFEAGATGELLTYQWLRQGTNLAGRTEPVLTLTNVASAMAGGYSVVVSNIAGAVTSAPALLTVAASVVQPPVPQSLSALRSTGFTLDVVAEAGRGFRVEASDDLVRWVEVTNFVGTAEAERFVDAAARGLDRRFYRIASP